MLRENTCVMDVVLAICKSRRSLSATSSMSSKCPSLCVTDCKMLDFARQRNDEVRDADRLPDRCFRRRWTASWTLRGFAVASVSNPEMSNHESQG